MRESCTYGSMRGRAYPITRGVLLYSTPSESLDPDREAAKGDDDCITKLTECRFRDGTLLRLRGGV